MNKKKKAKNPQKEQKNKQIKIKLYLLFFESRYIHSCCKNYLAGKLSTCKAFQIVYTSKYFVKYTQVVVHNNDKTII